MRTTLCFYQFWGLFFHCYGVPNSQKQWLSSMAPTIAPLSASSNIPWLVSMAETCQEVILNRWEILSKESCLTKLKPFHSDISRVIDQEAISLVYNICLHPSFSPQGGTDPVKGDTRLVLFQYPISGEEIPLSHTHIIFWKSYHKCLYRYCRVCQYQKQIIYGTSIKKLSVKFLDLSFCHHQHVYMATNNNLCICSQPACRVQQGSPVFCLFGIHWKLVGLVRESSMLCYDPILIIKTAPYFSWMRWLIKASQKPWDPNFSLLCSFFPREEHDPQDSLSHNTGSAVLVSSGFSLQSWRKILGTFPLDRQRRNHPLLFFDSKNRDYYPRSRQLNLQSSQLSSSRKLPMVQFWNSPIAKIWDPSDIGDPWDTQVADASESLVLSRPQKPKTTDIPIPWDPVYTDAVKYQHGTITNSVSPWIKSFAGITRHNTLSVVNAGRSWILLSSDQVLSEINTLFSRVKSSTFPFHNQFIIRPWIKSTPDFGPWIYSVPDKRGKMVWIQSSKENIRTQMHHIAKIVNTDSNVETYNKYPWVPLLADKIELWTHSTLSENGSQYSIVVHTLEPWFKPTLNIFRSQKTVKSTNVYWIFPESRSTLLSSAFNVPFSWVLSKGDTIKSLAQYKTRGTRTSRQKDRISPVSKHEITILKPQMHTEDTMWFSIHPVANVIEPKVDVIRFWNQLGLDRVQRPWIWSKFQIDFPRTQIKEYPLHWRHPKASTIRFWTQTKISTVMPWKQPESDTVGSWFWSKSVHMKLEAQPNINIFQTWTHSKPDIDRLWTQTKVQGIQLLRKPEIFTLTPWIQSKLNTLIPWTNPNTTIVRVLLQTQTNYIRFWSQVENQLNLSWYETKVNRVLTWYHTQVDTFKTWIETERQTMHPWPKHENNIARYWTQTQHGTVQYWFQPKMETVPQWTEPVTKTVHKWIQSETEIVRDWNQSVADKFRALILSEAYTIRTQDKLISEKIRFWTQPEVNRLRSWFHANIINPWSKTEASILAQWIQTESSEVNPWTQYETDLVTLPSNVNTPKVNLWTAILTEIVTTWIKVEFQGMKVWTQSKVDLITMWTQTESLVLNPWILYKTNKFTTWIPALIPFTKLIPNIVTTVTQNKLPGINSWTKSIAHIVTSLAQAQQSSTNPWTKTIVTIISQSQAIYPIVNTWVLSELDSVSWIQTDSLSLKSFLQSKTETVVQWTKSEFSTANPWKQFEKVLTEQWTHTESKTVTSWVHLISDTVIICTQVESLSLYPWTESDTYIVTIWNQTKTQPVVANTVKTWIWYEVPAKNIWSETISDRDASWTQGKFSVGNLWTQFETVTEWVLDDPPPENQWTQTIDAGEKLWSTGELTVLNILMESVPDSVKSWIQGKSPAINLWALPLSNKFVPWAQAVSATEKTWTEATVTPIVTAWLQSDSFINLRGKIVSETILPPGPQDKYSTGNLWPVSLSDKIRQLWFQPKFLSLNQETKPVTDTRTTPWFQMEYVPGHLWILPVSDIVKQMWPQAKTPGEILWPQSWHDEIRLPWPQTESIAVILWTLLITDTTTLLWPQIETSAMNLLLVSDISSWLQAGYLTESQWNLSISAELTPHMSQTESSPIHLWELLVSDTTIAPWPQAKSPIQNLWPQPFFNTVTPLRPQSESSAINLWTFLISDTTVRLQVDYSPADRWTLHTSDKIILPWPQDESLAENLWPMPSSDTIIPPWMQDDPIVSLWRLQIFDTITATWSQTEYLPRNLPPLSDIITPLRLQDETPAGNLGPQTLTDKITASRLQAKSQENLWTLLVSDTIIVPWPQVEYSPVNIWTLPVSDTIPSSWPQDKSQPVNVLLISDAVTQPWPLTKVSNVWAQPVTDIFMGPWSQAEFTVKNTWPQPLSDAIIPPWIQTKFQPVNLWTLPVSDIFVAPWSEDVISAGNLWPLSDTIESQRFQTEYEPVNLWPDPISDTITSPWPETKSPAAYSWAYTVTDTITPLWRQAESPLENVWLDPTSYTLISAWYQTESLETTTWTYAASNTIIPPWSQDESSPINLWILSVLNTINPSWLHSESLAINPRSLLLLDKYPAQIPWTEIIAGIFTPWNESEFLTLNLWIQSVSDALTPLSQVESLFLMNREQAISDPVTPQNQIAFSTIYLLTRYETDTFKEFSAKFQKVNNLIQTMYDSLNKANIASSILWKKLGTNTDSQLAQASSKIINFWTKAIDDKITPVSQGFSVAVNPWMQFESDTVTIWIPAKSPILIPWTQSKSDRMASWSHTLIPVANLLTVAIIGTDTLWNISEISLVAGTQSAKEIVTQWSQNKHTAGNFLTQVIFDTVILFTQTFSSLVNHWTQPETNAVMLWIQDKSLRKNTWTETDSETVTPWNHGKFSKVKNLPEAYKVTLWQQTIYKEVIPKVDDLTKIVKLSKLSKPSALKTWTQLIAETTSTWKQTESPEIHHWTQLLFDEIPLKTQIDFPLANTCIQDETKARFSILSDSSTVNIQTDSENPGLISSIKDKTSRITLRSQAENYSTQLATETVKSCIPVTFNSFLQKSNVVTSWSQFESVSIYPWKRAKVPKIIPWRQIESPPVYSRTGAIDSNVISWIQAESPLIYSQIGATTPTVISWAKAEMTSIKLWRVAIESNIIPLTQAEFPIVDTWVQPVAFTDTLSAPVIYPTLNSRTQPLPIPIIIWTHFQASTVITKIQSESETFIPWIQDKSPILNSLAQYVLDKGTPWTQVLPASERFWTEALSSTFIPWSLTEYLVVISSRKPLSETVMPWILAQFPAAITWKHHIYDALKSWNQVESSGDKIWIEDSALTVIQWTQDESPALTLWTNSINSTTTGWRMNEFPMMKSQLKASASTATPGIQTDFQTENSYIHIKTDTGTFSRILITEVKSRALLEVNVVRISVQPQSNTIQSKNYVSLLWTHTDTWMLPEIGTFLSWMVSVPQADRLWSQPEFYVSRAWFKIQAESLRQWNQADLQTLSIFISFSKLEPQAQYKTASVISWVQSKNGLFDHWTQSAVDIIRFWTIFEAKPWIQTNTIRPLTQGESQIVSLKFWIPPKSQATRSLSEADKVTLWSLTQNDAIRPSFQLGSKMIHLSVEPEVDKTNPWTQHKGATIRPWTKSETLEVFSWIQPGRKIAYLFQSEIDSLRPWSQPETNTIQIWTQTIKQVVKTSILVGVDIVTHWLQTQDNKMKPQIQIVSQTEVGKVGSWTHQRLATNHYVTYPETKAFRPWDKLKVDRIRSWSHIQKNKGILWTYSESQIFGSLIQPEFGIIHSLMQHKMEAVRPSSQTKSYIVKTWSQVVHQVLKSWTLFGGRPLISWIQSETHPDKFWTHLGVDVLSFHIPNPDKVRIWMQPETKTQRPGTHYKANIIASFTSSKTKSGRETLLSHLGIWSKIIPFVSLEMIPSLNQYLTLSTERAALESQDKSSFLQPSHLTNIVVLTLSKTWLLETIGYQNFGSKLQIIKTNGTLDVQAPSHTSLPPIFSFLISCSLSFPCALSSSCLMFSSCSFPSSCTSPLCSIFSPVALFSPFLLPSINSNSLLQEIFSSEFTEDTILSHPFSPLNAALATILTKESPLVPGFQSGPKSKYQPEQRSLKHSELNVSLAECRLGMVWNDNLQALWLFKTAVVSHETTECGLRSSLIPHCPNCWEAEMGEFPWMVSVQLSFSHFCAGSILNEQWILTSARCANFIKSSEALALIQVGLIDLQDPSQAQSVGIHHAIPYLGPQGPLGPGLIFLKQPLHFHPMVLPICLEETMDQERNIQLYDCWLPSWSLMRGSPGILQKRHLSILQVSTCAQFWPRLNEFTFCVEAKKAMGEAGCKGDLGAPLVCHLQQKDTWVQVGILSHFDEHCTKPYVFSQVSPFIFWLQGVTRPSHAPWSQEGPMTTSVSLSVSTSRNNSAFTSTTASVRPHFISLPQPQTLADRISLRYTMPWQAMIISCGSQICSGSIISSSWVLTAAHCVRNMNPEDTVVILGFRHPGTPLRLVKVSTILLHEKFRLVSGVARNDLALLLLQEATTSIQILAPLGHLKNLNRSECWLSGPQILKPGETDENPEMLQIQVMGPSRCSYLYPDIGSSILCFMILAKGPDTSMEPVSPGSAVMCRPVSGNGKWTQIGITSLKALATVLNSHISWILSTSAKTGNPLNQELMPWVEKPKSSSILKEPTILPLSLIMIITAQTFL